MALESATYISDLVSTNPTSSDNLSQGDDHLRLLKSTIKATFPNVSGAVTPTHTDLNKLTASGSPQFSTIELGNASDTTISRSAAGVIAVEGGVIPKENRANTFSADQVINANVGIGTAPAAKLHVDAGGTDEVIRLSNTSNPFISWYRSGVRDTYFQAVSTSTVLVVEANKPLAFHTNNTERMRIASTGDVLIGKTSAATTGAGIWAAGTGYLAVTRVGTTSQSHVQFVNDNGVVGSIITNGSATTYATSSDYRLKQNETPVFDPIGRFMQLKPISFEWKSDGVRVDGFFAHEVANVVPEAVVGTKDAVDADGNPIYQGIDQSKLVPLLTAALQEALTKIEALEARITALEAA